MLCFTADFHVPMLVCFSLLFQRDGDFSNTRFSQHVSPLYGHLDYPRQQMNSTYIKIYFAFVLL